MNKMKYATRSGMRWEEASTQDRLLEKLYGTLPGRLLIRMLVLPQVSVLGGMLLSSHLSTAWIPGFVKAHNLRAEDWEKDTFTSYNDFFMRKLKPECRPIAQEEAKMIAPCDGKLMVYPITEQGSFQIKGRPYTVTQLLKNERLAKRFLGGHAFVYRLTVSDYHRYCYTESGEKSENYQIPGVFHTVNPVANEKRPIYKENTREFCLLRTENFGTLLQMEVGALMVGKIENRHGACRVRRGQEKGNFAFGGSTIIVLAQKGQVQPDEDLLVNSRDGYETFIRMGETVGRKDF